MNPAKDSNHKLRDRAIPNNPTTMHAIHEHWNASPGCNNKCNNICKVKRESYSGRMHGTNPACGNSKINVQACIWQLYWMLNGQPTARQHTYFA